MAKNKGYVPHKTLLHSSGGAEEQPQCWGERGNQTEKLGPCEDQGPSKQEEDCIHQSPCTNHTHRVISILAHSSPNAHMHHSPNTHLFQSSSPTTPRFLFWFESSSSLMVTFLGQRRLASFPGSLQPGKEAKRRSDDSFSMVKSTPNSSGSSRLEVSDVQK